MFSAMKEKGSNIFLAFVFIFVPMWAVYGLNWLSGGLINHFGIHPRTFSFFELIGIMFSWCMHADLNHITNNSIGLVGLLFFIGLLEQRVFKLLAVLIITSGLSTWVLGGVHSVHVGASGLLFAMFGYVLSAATVGRKWRYLIPVGIAFFLYGFAYFGSFLNGLAIKEGISFAAHFGGLLSGILTGVYFEKSQETKSYVRPKTLKEKWADFVWDVKFKFKKVGR